MSSPMNNLYNELTTHRQRVAIREALLDTKAASKFSVPTPIYLTYSMIKGIFLLVAGLAKCNNLPAACFGMRPQDGPSACGEHGYCNWARECSKYSAASTHKYVNGGSWNFIRWTNFL